MQLTPVTEYIGFEIIDRLGYPVGNVEYAYLDENRDMKFIVGFLNESFEIKVDQVINTDNKNMKVWIY